jgi:hypothetical protein
MMIPVMKTITYQVENGQLELRKVNDKDTWGNPCVSIQVYYHNPRYKNSPFKCPQSFSSEFNEDEIVNSSEIVKFLEPFNK